MHWSFDEMFDLESIHGEVESDKERELGGYRNERRSCKDNGSAASPTAAAAGLFLLFISF